MTECLIGLGAIAIMGGPPAAGARLLAAAVALRGPRAASVWPAKPLDVEPHLELARARLSEAQLEAERALGRAMSLEQAVEFARSLPLQPGIPTAARTMPDGLTEREREIAALIGQGKTNGEIAEELVLSKRTVESHVSKIFSKLALSGRSQVMRWAIDHGLTRTSA